MSILQKSNAHKKHYLFIFTLERKNSPEHVIITIELINMRAKRAEDFTCI